MNESLVPALREIESYGNEPNTRLVCGQAADEIERLRERFEALVEACRTYHRVMAHPHRQGQPL